MNESQIEITLTPGTLEAIKGELSTQRLHKYMVSAGFDDNYALSLYLYNCRLSAAMLFPLHVLEVTVRNAINTLFISNFGFNWSTNPAFINLLTYQSQASLNRSLIRLRQVKSSSSTDDLVAELSFDFWSNLFRPEYDRALWQTQVHKLLPSGKWTRKSLQLSLREINRIRNRIAHHEPILNDNISATYGEILSILQSRSPPLHDWVKAHSTLPQTIRTHPRNT